MSKQPFQKKLSEKKVPNVFSSNLHYNSIRNKLHIYYFKMLYCIVLSLSFFQIGPLKQYKPLLWWGHCTPLLHGISLFFTPSWCTYSPMRSFGLWDFKMDFNPMSFALPQFLHRHRTLWLEVTYECFFFATPKSNPVITKYRT